MAANPKKAVQNMRKKIQSAIKDIRSGGDIKKLNKLKIQLDRLNAIGGLDAVVPTEGIVFKYNGNVRFKNIQAFDSSNKRVQVKYHYNGDEWRNVQDSFNRAVVEYTHYNRSILLEEQLQTIVFYKPKDRLMYARKEGLNMRAIVAKPIEKNSLKKLRGNYVRH